eukprot:1945153-Prymnesium_polylepis.1
MKLGFLCAYILSILALASSCWRRLSICCSDGSAGAAASSVESKYVSTLILWREADREQSCVFARIGSCGGGAGAQSRGIVGTRTRHTFPLVHAPLKVRFNVCADGGVAEDAEQRELAVEAWAVRARQPPAVAQHRGHIVVKRRVDDGRSGSEPVEHARAVVAHLVEVGLQLLRHLGERIRARGGLVRLHGCRTRTCRGSA